MSNDCDDDDDERFFRTQARKFIFHPDSLKRCCWEMISLGCVLMDCVFMPLNYFELPLDLLYFLWYLDWLIRFFWTCDIVVSFLSGYTKEDGDVEMRPRLIVWRYLRTSTSSHIGRGATLICSACTRNFGSSVLHPAAMGMLQRLKAAAVNAMQNRGAEQRRAAQQLPNQRIPVADALGGGPCLIPIDVLDRLPRVKPSEVDKEAECSVCLSELVAYPGLVKLPCNHIYHKECLRRWFVLQSTCPVCRHDCLPDMDQSCKECPQPRGRTVAPRNCDDVDWINLTEREQSAARLLGFTQFLWDNDRRVASECREWHQLSYAQRNAWTTLGWNQRRWG